TTAQPNAAAIAAVPIQPAERPGHRFHPRAITTVPTSGQSSTSQANVVAVMDGPRSPVELVQLVDVDRQPATVDGDDQAQPDRDLARGDHHDDQREYLAVLAAPHACKRHQPQVGPIEHQLQAEQDHEWVAASQYPRGADAKDHG